MQRRVASCRADVYNLHRSGEREQAARGKGVAREGIRVGVRSCHWANWWPTRKLRRGPSPCSPFSPLTCFASATTLTVAKAGVGNERGERERVEEAPRVVWSWLAQSVWQHQPGAASSITLFTRQIFVLLPWSTQGTSSTPSHPCHP